MRELGSLSWRWVVVLAVVLGAGNAFAGVCGCETETYIRVLMKKATKEEISACEKELDGYKVDLDESFRCLAGLRYRHVESGELPAETFRSAIDAFVAQNAAGQIIDSEAYRDKGLREKLRPLMVRTKNVALWDALAKNADGDKAGFTQVLYFYCERYPTIAGLLQADKLEPKLTLAHFWPLPAGMTPKQATQRMKCPYGQQLLLEAAIRSLEGELPPPALALLSANQLRILRNAVYARHGRPFDSKDLKDYFTARSWYRADSTYTDERLTPVDKRNLEILQKAEKGAR
jgi:hypothetical protein